MSNFWPSALGFTILLLFQSLPQFIRHLLGPNTSSVLSPGPFCSPTLIEPNPFCAILLLAGDHEAAAGATPAAPQGAGPTAVRLPGYVSWQVEPGMVGPQMASKRVDVWMWSK